LYRHSFISNLLVPSMDPTLEHSITLLWQCIYMTVTIFETRSIHFPESICGMATSGKYIWYDYFPESIYGMATSGKYIWHDYFLKSIYGMTTSGSSLELLVLVLESSSINTFYSCAGGFTLTNCAIHACHAPCNTQVCSLGRTYDCPTHPHQQHYHNTGLPSVQLSVCGRFMVLEDGYSRYSHRCGRCADA
jgi:hypothetical protein